MKNDTELWEPLTEELERWERAGKQARFWLRDDDAVVPTGALDRLLALAIAYSVPMTLAVIPKETGPALAKRLQYVPGISVALHGWSHKNYAPLEEKKQETVCIAGRMSSLRNFAPGPRISPLFMGRRSLAC